MKGGNLLIIIGILIASEISKIPRKPQKGGAYAEIGLLLLLVAIIVAVVLIIKHGVAKKAEKKKKDAEKKKKDAEKKKKDAEKKKKDNKKKHHPPSHPEIKCLTTDISGPQKKPDGVVDVEDLLKVLAIYETPCKKLQDAKTATEIRSKLFHCLAKHPHSQSSKVNVDDLLKVLADFGKKSKCD